MTKIGTAPAAQSLELVLPLQADLAGLGRLALEVTTPGSPRYGRYQSIAQLARRYGASAATRGQVLGYLRRVGARDVNIDVTGLFADATMSAGLAERLFATPLAQFRADRGGRFVAPALGGAAAAVRLPAALRGLVTGVIGLDTRSLLAARELARASQSLHSRAHFASQASSARPHSGTPRGCPRGVASDGFTPNQYLTAYGYDPLHDAGLAGQGERVALIEIDGFKYPDIRAFARCFGLGIPALNGFGVGVAPGGESTLDLEVLDAAAPGLKSIDVYETRSSAANTLRALTAPLHNRQKPQVISASLGLCEPALFRAVGSIGIETTEGALEMAAASGITVLASSGDQGSADCTAQDGAPINLLAVNYPASSWWVTGVGGTNLVLNAANQITSQIVWNDDGDQPGSAGGGGASRFFRRPPYQKSSTASRARAVPDVSMLADIMPGYAIYCSVRGDCINPGNSNPWLTVGGTSASTPLLAGGLAIVDQVLHLHHKQDLGLVNPLLYSAAGTGARASIFYDVTAIGNDVGPDIPGNGQPLGCCQAHVGYDEASGLGSVNLTGVVRLAVDAQQQLVSVGLSLPANQKPVRVREILAGVACSGPCLMGAYAEVAIGRAKPFEVLSRVYRMRSNGRRTVGLHFSGRQLRRLSSALAAGKAIFATVHGVVFDRTVYDVLADPAGAIQKRTGGRTLAITG
jgi:subtilase family serine protease